MQAIIIGGGVGGTATAIALGQAGIEPRVFERRSDAVDVEAGTGLTLWPNAMVSLRKLGVAPEIEAQGSALQLLVQRTWRGRELNRVPVGEIARRSGIPAVNVTRAHLAGVLRSKVEQPRMVMGATCTGFAQNGSTVTATFEEGRTEEGDVLIGADGINSVVREQLLGAEKPRYAGYTAWRGLTQLEHEGAPRHTFVQLIGRGKRFFWYWVNDTQIYWIAIVNAPEGQADDPGRVGDDLAERFAGWPEPVLQLIGATAPTSILRTDIYDRPPATHWGTGPATLVGDAGHAMTFNIGQGACQAIVGAVALAGHLHDDGNIDNALRAYEAERIAATSPMIENAWRNGRIGQWSNPVACWVRERYWSRLVRGGGVFA